MRIRCFKLAKSDMYKTCDNEYHIQTVKKNVNEETLKKLKDEQTDHI